MRVKVMGDGWDTVHSPGSYIRPGQNSVTMGGMSGTYISLFLMLGVFLCGLYDTVMRMCHRLCALLFKCREQQLYLLHIFHREALRHGQH